MSGVDNLSSLPFALEFLFENLTPRSSNSARCDVNKRSTSVVEEIHRVVEMFHYAIRIPFEFNN